MAQQTDATCEPVKCLNIEQICAELFVDFISPQNVFRLFYVNLLSSYSNVIKSSTVHECYMLVYSYDSHISGSVKMK